MNILTDVNQRLKLAREIQRLREIQLVINKKMIAGEFLVPIHLAIGYEALAVSLAQVLDNKDKLMLTHRNIHYQLALGATEQQLAAEYQLKSTGLASGKLGSMNLMNPTAGNIYTSNILGNNMAVSLGVGLASKIKGDQSVIWVVTGDGAIEEGVFYESALFASSAGLPIIFLVENNEWSLGTSIDERRTKIGLQTVASSLSIDYLHLSGNDPVNYLSQFQKARINTLEKKRPIIIEADVHSLGGFYKDEGEGKKRYINYHAGAIRIEPDSNNIFENNDSDPLFVVSVDLALGNV